jgi:hypothetical protein
MFGLAALSGQAVAESTWTLGTDSAAGGGAVPVAGTNVKATVTAWADTTDSLPRQLQQQSFTRYGSGLGVTNLDKCGSSPL